MIDERDFGTMSLFFIMEGLRLVDGYRRMRKDSLV